MNESQAKGALKFFVISGVLFALFIALISAVLLIDVQAIGPQDSKIGLATLNGAVRDFFGSNEMWYNITEAFGLLALAAAGGFGVLGLYQLIRRKSIKSVDANILLLGAFYICVLASYVFFEVCVINYRPVLTEGELEASFPSSHTMLVVSIMATAAYQLVKRIKNIPVRYASLALCALVAIVTAFGRLACGVHWATDIFGGLLLSGALVFLYIAFCRLLGGKQIKQHSKEESQI